MSKRRPTKTVLMGMGHDGENVLVRTKRPDEVAAEYAASGELHRGNGRKKRGKEKK